jgi:hypothetical protein
VSYRLLHFHPSGELMGAWSADASESWYVPSVSDVWRGRAELLLQERGSQVSWSEWFEQLADSTQYRDTFGVLDCPEEEPLEATVGRVSQEIVERQRALGR